MDAKIQDFISSFISYLNEVDVSLKSGEASAKQNGELKDKLQLISEENEKLATELSQKKSEIRDMNEKLLVLSAQRRASNDELSKDMISQAIVVKTKYEVEILQSRVKSLERELQIHKCDNERLNRENQSLKRGLNNNNRN